MKPFRPNSGIIPSILPAWVAIGLAIGAWEVFLRLGSRAVTLATKLWLLPLLALTVTGVLLTLGAWVGVLTRMLRPERLRR